MKDMPKYVFDTVIDRIKDFFYTNGYAKDVKIYQTLGAAANDYRDAQSGKIVSVLYGVYRQQSSQISTVADALHMVTGAGVIDFIVDVPSPKEGEHPELDEIMALLRGCATAITGDWFEASMADPADSSKTVQCAVMPVVSLPVEGYYQEESSNWGAYIPVSIQISFTAIQGGIVPSKLKIDIDGKRIPVTDMVIARTKAATTDVHVHSANGSTGNSDESTTLEIQLACPAQYSTTGFIMDELIGGGTNIPHCVTVGGNDAIPAKAYLMEIAKAQLTKSATAALGFNVNLLELDIQSADFAVSDRWQTAELSASASNSCTASIKPGAGKWCIFWGDGSSDGPKTFDGDATISHKYQFAGSYKAVRYKLG